MRFPAKSVLHIFRLLEESGVPVWLDGGWGIDALLKRETREHRDLDLIIPVECLSAVESVLGDVGFLKDDRQTLMPAKFVLSNSEGLQIDLHPVTLKPDGSAEHIDFDDTSNFYTFVHSAAGLSGVGMIDGRVVRCTTGAEQIRQKVERRYSPWRQHRIRANGVSADLEDVISLQQEFGICESKLALVATGPEEAPPTHNAIDNATEKFCIRHLAQLNAQHSQLIARHAELTAQHAELTADRAQLNAMRTSTSWRMTAPMRWTVNWIRAHWSAVRNQ